MRTWDKDISRLWEEPPIYTLRHGTVCQDETHLAQNPHIVPKKGRKPLDLTRGSWLNCFNRLGDGHLSFDSLDERSHESRALSRSIETGLHDSTLFCRHAHASAANRTSLRHRPLATLSIPVDKSSARTSGVVIMRSEHARDTQILGSIKEFRMNTLKAVDMNDVGHQRGKKLNVSLWSIARSHKSTRLSNPVCQRNR